MNKIIYLAVTAMVIMVTASCDTKEKCWKVNGTLDGLPGEWYEDGTKADVEEECREKGIKDYTLSEANEYTEHTCPDTMDALADRYDD